MDISVNRHTLIPTICIIGELDLASAPSLSKALDEFLPIDAPIIVDLSDVTFIDSSGLSVLVQARQRLGTSSTGNPIRLVVVRPAVQRIFEITGLDQVFEIYDSNEGAQAKLG